MAEQQQSATSSAAFPAPPPFYKHFTTENLARLEEIKASNQSAIEDIPSEAPAKSQPPIDFASLPNELRYLIPPSPPTGQYQSFSFTHDAAPTPSPADPSALPNPHRLRTIVHRILLEFLGLVHILATDPALHIWVPRWEKLRDTFVEAHGVINDYRPHQAKESLIEMMEEQIRKGREEIRLCAEAKTKVEEVLKGLGKVEGASDGSAWKAGKALAREKRKREADKEVIDRQIWRCLEKEVGT